MPDLDFTQHNSIWGTHGIHAYAAKFPPQLVKYGIRHYSHRGDLVVDPMMGSGTTLVEARVLGRNAVGYDIDPLARLIAKVKSTPVDTTLVTHAAKEIVARIYATLDELPTLPSVQAFIDAKAPEFHNRDYWFLPSVTNSLTLLAYHITHVETSDHIRDFLWIAFSSLILARTSVANARDIIHSRHHFFEHAVAPDVVAKFTDRLKRMCRQMDEFVTLIDRKPHAETRALLGDARCLPLETETVDLVVTSPPYATALDYPRAHFLAVAWMEQRLGITLKDYMNQAPRYVGSERGRLMKTFQLNDSLSKNHLAAEVLAELAKESTRQSNLVQRYFVDMKQVLSEVSRILKHKRHALIVVCPSHLRRVEIPTHEVLIEFAEEVGLRTKHVHVRTIAANRRVLPYAKEAFGQRMSTEYVLVLQKR